MRKFLFLVFLIFCLITVVPVVAVSYPNPVGYVNDFASLYSAEFRQNLENNLSNFEKVTGSEIAVVTIQSLEGTDIETYAVTLFEKWKIGKKGKDNGLLLLISKDDRKVRVEVGYGLEPYITDGRAGEIIRNQISPEFKKENYEGGTLAAIEKIQKYISDKDIAPVSSPPKSGDFDFWIVIGILFVSYTLITYISSYLGRTREIWPGAVLGGIFGGIGGFIIAAVIGIIIGSIVFGLVGLLLDYILTKNFNERRKKGLPTDFFHTWGGFSGGGRGGGFGGFGGGSSGGGGASGGW